MGPSLRLAFALQILLACGGKLAAEDNVGTMIPGGPDEEDTVRPKRPPDRVLVPFDAGPKSSRVVNDLDDPKVAEICAARANEPRGKLYEETTRAYVLTNGYDAVTSSLAKETKSGETFETVLQLTFTTAPTIIAGPSGLVRTDRVATYEIAALSSVSRPVAFPQGTTEKIEVRSAATYETACWRNGERSDSGGSSAGHPAPTGTFTVTEHSPTAIAGVLELPAADGTARITLYAPIAAPRIDEEPYICCLKN